MTVRKKEVAAPRAGADARRCARARACSKRRASHAATIRPIRSGVWPCTYGFISQQKHTLEEYGRTGWTCCLSAGHRLVGWFGLLGLFGHLSFILHFPYDSSLLPSRSLWPGLANGRRLLQLRSGERCGGWTGRDTAFPNWHGCFLT